jgi:probable FeS assembly SUF system protein SufT
MSMTGYGRESICLLRDVNVVRIPDGTPDQLPKGHLITLSQSLGGNFTVLDETGHMVRIAGEDADALGKEPPIHSTIISGTDLETVEKNVWEVLKTIYDPEIPVNIVELGLVYHCGLKPLEQSDFEVHIIMTLTAPGCGMGPVLQLDAEAAVKALPGVHSVRVEVVFDPPWSRDRMSEAALLQLGMI